MEACDVIAAPGKNRKSTVYIPDRVRFCPAIQKGDTGIHILTKDKERLKRVMQMEPEYWKYLDQEGR